MIRQYVVALMFSLVVAGALVGTPAPTALAGDGRTTTRLPDGRLLLVGGLGPSGPENGLSVFDLAAQTTIRLNVQLRDPRSWHSATVLPTGAILIAGGVGADGQAVATAERFDLATETLTAIGLAGAAGRAGHTATLLTDGRLFIVGGQDGAGGLVANGEVWDLEAGTATPVRGLQPRIGHNAALLADGRVRISGGAALDDIFDPRSGHAGPITARSVEPFNTGLIAESQPGPNAHDVALDARITVRFAHNVDPDTITAQSVVLSSAAGAVAAHVVVAEHGRLAFVWPLNLLEPETTYHLAITGVRDPTARPLAAGQLTFTTIKSTKPNNSDDDDLWIPVSANPDTWRTNRPPSPWQALPALQAEAGATAVAGQVLTLDGRPLRDVTLEIGEDSTRTDSTGRFLLRVSNGEAGRQEMGIDGSTANHANRVYGFFEYGLTLATGTTTVLPFTIWMPRLDVAHEVDIASPTAAETVITTPYIPGLELHLPPRAIIRGEDGRPVTRLGITPIPVDRPPFPLAKNIEVPVYFTVQPGSAYVRSYGPGPSGAWVVYPNYRRTAEPGQVLQFFHYDPEEKDWYVYGVGTVTPDGAQVVPDARTRLYEFTGAMLQTGDPVPAGGWTPGGPGWSDPVDPSTGVFGLHKTDLFLPDVIPLALTRTYNSADTATARPFGRGMTHPYAMFLWSAQQWQQADLILPEGGRVHFVRTSAGTSWTDAVFAHQETSTTSATPTVWYKSVITWNGNGWNLRRTDGTVFVFGENAPLQRIRDRYGNTVSITRTNGQSGNITRITSSHGRWISFTYDSSNHVIQATDNIGRTVRYTYTSAGNLSTVTDPENGVTTYTWTASNQVATITDPRNIVFLSNTYTNGRVTAQASGDGTSITQFAYTLAANGAVAQTDITDPRGGVERLFFNTDHYIVSDVRAAGLPEQQTTTIERLPGANLTTAAVDSLGRRSEFQFDAFGHAVRVTRLAGTSDALTTAISYEPQFFQPASIVDPLGHTWAFSYDAFGSVSAITDPIGRRTTATVDASGRITSVTNPLQHVWRFSYRGADVASATDPLNAVHSVFADAGGRVVAAIDPLGGSSRFVWSNLDPMTSIDPVGGQASLSYDGNGNVLAFADPLGHVTAYAYDAFDRLQSRTDPMSRTETWQYDASDNVIRTVDRTGRTTTYEYDTLDRLSLITFADGSTIGVAYDAANRITRIVDSSNGTTTWTYDFLDRVTQASTPEGTVSYSYDGDGRRTSMAVSGQAPVTYSYDDAHQLTGVAQGSAIVATGYDAGGRRSSVAYPNGIVAAYDYDAADRVTGLTYSLAGTTIGNLAYAYDAAGNRIAMDGSLSRTSLPAALAGATYDAANRISAWGGMPFTHDANGNVTSDGLHTFQWNARNLLASVSGGADGVFQYDALGRRRAKTALGSTTRYVYDGVNVVQEQTANGVPSANLLTGLGLDETFMRTDGAAQMLLPDVLGSTLGLADASGALGTTYTYSPFGATVAAGAANSNSAQFTGRENDGTGLYYYRARYYAPDLGRFISEDPLEFAGGDANLYAYVGNRPTRAKDPFGLYNRDVHFDLTGTIGLQVGMCPADAWRIADANQGIDDDLWTSPTVIPNANARRLFHFTTAERRSQLRNLAFSTGSRYVMGAFLHAFQDSYSHQHARKDRDGEPYGPSIGHLLDWKTPDDPRDRPSLWGHMVDATARELWQFHQKFPGCQRR